MNFMEAPKCQSEFVRRMKVLSSYLIIIGVVVLGTGIFINYAPMIVFGTLFLGFGIGSLSVQLVLKHDDFKPTFPEEVPLDPVNKKVAEETPVVVQEQIPDSVVVEEKPIAEPITIEIFDENGKDKEVQQ